MPDMDPAIWWDLWGHMLKSASRELNNWWQVRTPAELALNAWTDVMLAGLR